MPIVTGIVVVVVYGAATTDKNRGLSRDPWNDRVLFFSYKTTRTRSVNFHITRVLLLLMLLSIIARIMQCRVYLMQTFCSLE